MKYIEPLDTKNECTTCYFEGALVEVSEVIERHPEETFCSYRWSPVLDNLPTEPIIASLYNKSVPFSETPGFPEIEKKIRAHIKASRVAKVCPTVCFSDLLPEWDIKAFSAKKSEAIATFLRSNEKPKNYDHLLKIQKLICSISQRDVSLDVSKVKSTKQLSIYQSSKRKVTYDAFKTSTGRLTTTKDSFPILTLPAKDRSFITPENDIFIEFDFNAAELRTLLAIGGNEQPLVDIHEWNMTICEDYTTRTIAKEKFFAWLYNPRSRSKDLEAFYKKDIYKQFYSSGQIHTPFNRSIKVSEEKALNYLIQSTSSDLTLEQADKIRLLLKGRNSFIKFLMHDSVVLDVDKSDLPMMELLYDTFKKTRFGNYVVNVRHGTDFSNLRSLKWKT